MTKLTEQAIRDSLLGIIDPDFNQDIVTLGFVKNIQVSQGNVSFDIELTTPACPVKEEFRQKAVDAVSKLNGVERVDVRMTSQKRAKPSGFQAQSTLNDVRSIIAVSSCKGGVGKSTIAAHLAQELANRRFKVGLVDVDVHGP